MTLVAFYGFAGLYLLSGLLVVTLRNPMHAALSLVLAFFSSAALWLFLQAEFLALLLVLIYVGAVMVLFLFVVLLLDINLAVLREGFIRWLPVGGAVAIAMAVGIIAALYTELEDAAGAVALPADYGSAAWIGQHLYTAYLYPFELAGAVLLVAIVAAIAMTHRGRRRRRAQDPAAQSRVQASRRVRLVQLDKDS